jgi:hypothetical protein
MAPAARWRAEAEYAYIPRARKHYDNSRVKFEPGWRAAPRQSIVERAVLRVASVMLVIGALGCAALLYAEFRWSGDEVQLQPALEATARTSEPVVVGSGKGDFLAVSRHARGDRAPLASAAPSRDVVGSVDRTARGLARTPAFGSASVAASGAAPDWTVFEPAHVAVDRSRTTDPRSKQTLQLASLESPPQTLGRPRLTPQPIFPRLPIEEDGKTTLLDFANAPFPYDGRRPGSSRQFLDAGEAETRGHTTFRGRVLSASDTYGDDRVLVQIPPGFDPNKPSVMVVFFHGHRATLARDVRDRQKLPEQIAASGMNAVLVAPQFAVNAADSSAGKFWDQGGFKRFLDESAEQLARLHGDPRTAQVFANMPVVIVAYSGGYGPLLAVLSRGEVHPSRIRGLILLDALYSGMDKFASWIAGNRQAFFVSSYTPHTRGRNVELEQMLAARSIPYSSELRSDHLQGMVTFLPAGDISHRDFVTHAWADLPIKDMLVRMDDVVPKVQTAGRQSSYVPASATATVAAQSQ